MSKPLKRTLIFLIGMGVGLGLGVLIVAYTAHLKTNSPSSTSKSPAETQKQDSPSSPENRKPSDSSTSSNDTDTTFSNPSQSNPYTISPTSVPDSWTKKSIETDQEQALDIDSKLNIAYPSDALYRTNNAINQITLSRPTEKRITKSAPIGYSLRLSVFALTQENIDLQDVAYVKQQSQIVDVSDVTSFPTLNGYKGYTYTKKSSNTINTRIYYLPLDAQRGLIAHASYYTGDSAKDYRTLMEKNLAYIWTHNQALSSQVITNNPTISAPLLDTTQTKTGTRRGCDNVVFTEFEVDTLRDPLAATYQKLFALKDENPVPSSDTPLLHIIGRMSGSDSESLSFKNVDVSDGVARINLSGQATGFRGACDNPRPMIQLEEAALQFPSIHDVNIFLNGKETDLQPDSRGE